MAAEGGKELDVSVSVGDAMFTASGPADVVMRALADFRELVGAATPPKRERREKEPKDGAGVADIPDIDQPLATFRQEEVGEPGGQGNRDRALGSRPGEQGVPQAKRDRGLLAQDIRRGGKERVSSLRQRRQEGLAAQ